MKKLFKSYLIIWAILIVAFNAIVFITPGFYEGGDKFGGAFWAGYVLITAAFAGELIISFLFFKEENKDKTFLKIPLIVLSRSLLIVSFVAGALFMAVPNLPDWVGAVIAIAIAAFYAVAVVAAKTAADVVDQKDRQIKAQTSFIRSLSAGAKTLAETASDKEIKAECLKVYAALRYSDPMSNPVLDGINSRISAVFAQLTEAVYRGSVEDVRNDATILIDLIKNRNNQCKALK